MKKGVWLLFIFALIFVSACSNNTGGSGATDTVKVWTYPVHEEYEDELKELIKSFEAENENIKIEYEYLSWAEGPQKFDIALNSGTPPDIYFGKPQAKYVQTGLTVDLKDRLNVDVSDFDQVAIEHMSYDGGLYGLPIYMFLHVWGGNKQLMEEAGIDYEKIQRNGWTWSEFKELAAKANQTNSAGDQQYGFVFQGTNEELLVHLAMNNGLPYRVDTSGALTWTGDEILETMEYIRSLLDEGIMPRETAAIDPAKRMELFYNHQALFFGRAIPYFDPVVEARNQQIEEGEIEGEKIDFILLPIPHNEGEQQIAFGGAEGYMLFTQRNASDEHVANSIKVLEHLTSAEAGKAAVDLALPTVHKGAEGKFESKVAPYNEEAANVLAGLVLPPNDISIEVGALDDQFRTEVIIPTFQGVLNGEMSPEQALDRFKQANQTIFGQ
ncbi:ABC transporter substrate-binding protein [Bacillus horti]|uniref:Multiple sugar transport system substrate-binding protein n=2 Tax=Caldalkalibacillus horti TaxID=77523 RepID=A0ABT9VTL3_9BACI|nr:ABC transporter substrate-binding protein [Bacillus horti]MDQ0164317.1 multiple sugar transport system substrate-binding protein [Bacillus horti]